MCVSCQGHIREAFQVMSASSYSSAIVHVLWSAQQQNPCELWLCVSVWVHVCPYECVYDVGGLFPARGIPQILLYLSCVSAASSLSYQYLSVFVINTIESCKNYEDCQLWLCVAQFSHLHTAMISLQLCSHNVVDDKLGARSHLLLDTHTHSSLW